MSDQKKEQTKYYNYPASIGNEAKQGQHYVLFNSYKSESAISKKGIMISSIALYIPPGSLTSTLSQSYSEVAGGAQMAVMGRGQNFTANENDLWEKAVASGLSGADLVGGAVNRIETVQNFMSAGFGVAKNNKVALVYKGPGQFRTHTFNFTFFPKDKTEAEMVKALINDFQNGAAPTKLGFYGSADRVTHPFFGSPRQYEIKFMKGRNDSVGNTFDTTKGSTGSENTYLHTIKSSVIESLTINHDPNSVVSFHADGSPVSSSLSLQFKEIEYVTSENPADARQETVQPIAQEGPFP